MINALYSDRQAKKKLYAKPSQSHVLRKCFSKNIKSVMAKIQINAIKNILLRKDINEAKVTALVYLNHRIRKTVERCYNNSFPCIFLSSVLLDYFIHRMYQIIFVFIFTSLSFLLGKIFYIQLFPSILPLFGEGKN